MAVSICAILSFMKRISERELAHNVLLEMIEPLIGLGELWLEAGNPITPGWKDALISLKISGKLPKEARAFISAAKPVVANEDYPIENIIVLLIGFRIATIANTPLEKSRRYVAAAMNEMFDVASDLGMGQDEAEVYISSYMETARAMIGGDAS